MSITPAIPPAPAVGGTTALSAAEYHALTSAALAHIEATVDTWLDSDLVDIDTHRTGGMLELSLPNGSKLIVNSQPPLQELWLAARSGGHHYRWRDGAWRDTRDGSEFFAVLSACATEQAGLPLQFTPPDKA